MELTLYLCLCPYLWCLCSRTEESDAGLEIMTAVKDTLLQGLSDDDVNNRWSSHVTLDKIISNGRF